MSSIISSETFPHKVLTPIPHGDKPNFSNLLLIHQELNANAVTVPSQRGGGALGHLALVLPTATYDALPNAAAWIAPVHPGANPVHLVGATAAQITETNRQYQASLVEMQTYHAINAILKTQLLAAVPDTYTEILKDNQLGYANVTVLEILNHLDTTYGTVTADDLNTNLFALNRTWDPAQPIEDLWNQIRKCQTFAAPHDAITDATAIRAAVTNLENSGVFTDALRDWRKRPVAQHTLDNLKIDFNAADKERRRMLTAQNLGYANKTIVDNNKENNKTTTEKSNDMYYCWSHGLGPFKTHTSATCTHPQPGHQKTATMSDMRGGCCIIKRKKGERAIYKKPQRTPTQEAIAEE